ncbi:MAG: hypothetical protein GKC10_04320 [Methanosarcinales archaeon]|nr:hypothetical protein [Methanosarcinales archaeon]
MRMKRMAWGITGGGQHLEQSVEAVFRLSRDNHVCSFVSRAAEEVLHMYGVFERVAEISGGEYLEELILESQTGLSFPETGRFMLGRVDVLLVAPATANTVAKMAWGIADSLVTNAVAMANKSAVPVYVLPTDLEGQAQSRTPYSIDREICRQCDPCPAREGCPQGAVNQQIDLMRCDGCGTCASLCQYGAISAVSLRVKTREIDRRNLDQLRRFPGITVLDGPGDIEKIFQELAGAL